MTSPAITSIPDSVHSSSKVGIFAVLMYSSNISRVSKIVSIGRKLLSSFVTLCLTCVEWMYNDSIMLSEEVAQKLFAIAEKSELQ